MVETKACVLRDGAETLLPLAEIVPGDVVLLSAGAKIPGDGRLIESHELFVNEAVLTGETFPAGKEAQVIEPAAMGKTQVYLGTHIVSGWGKVEILHTGKETRLGKIAERLRLRRPETEFERGIRRFGYLLAEVTFCSSSRSSLSTSTSKSRSSIRCSSRSRSPSASPRNCCRRSSASIFPTARAEWPRRR